jgi:membrane protein YqaA with SNARE-associated domain
VIGGAFGYLIGYFVFDALMRLPLAHTLFGPDPLGSFHVWYARWGLAVILIKGLTPIPYKIVTIASGAAAFNFPLFMAASLVTRGGRFFLVATLLHHFGDHVREFIDRRLGLVTSLVAVGIVAGFVVIKYL